MATALPKLAQPAVRALRGVEISSIEDLAKYSEKEVKDLHGMGPSAMKTLQTAMAAANVSFRKD